MNKRFNAISQLLFLLGAPLSCWIIANIEPFEGLTSNGMACLGGCVWLFIWWMTEVLPLPVTSLMAIPIFSLMGVLEPGKTFAFIGHPAMMLIFGATIIVGLWKESNLIERYAYWCFTLPGVRSNPGRMLLAFILGAGVMSAIAPNLPLVILFCSISVAIAKSCELNSNDNMCRSLFAISAIAPTLGGIGTPLGGAPNIIVMAVVATALGHEITFAEWSILGMPICVLSLLCSFIILNFLYPLKGNQGFRMPEEKLLKKQSELGPVTLWEHAAIWIMVIALILWCAGPQIFRFFGMEKAAMLMNAPTVAILMGLATFLVPVRRNSQSGKLEFAMDWNKAVRNIAWGVIVLQIGAIAFGQVLLEGGIDKWAATLVQKFLGNASGTFVWAGLVFFTGILSQLIMSLAIIPLMIPVVISLAQIYGFDPLLASLSVGFCANLTLMFPFSSIPVAFVLQGGEGYAKSRDFIPAGFLVMLCSSAIAFMFCWLLGDALVG